MQLKLYKTGFSFRQNLLPILLGLLWLSLIALHLLVSKITGNDVSLCWVRNLTGFSCPTCGTTRVVLNLFRLDLSSAFLSNPLVFVLTFLVLSYFILRIFFQRDLRLVMDKKESILFWTCLTVVSILNWLYVIITQV